MKVIPVSEKSLDYAEKIYAEIRKMKLRVELDDRNEKVGYKIRSARQNDKVPYMIIVGEKEAAEGNISVRDRATDQTETTTLDVFVAKVKEEVETRKR